MGAFFAFYVGLAGYPLIALIVSLLLTSLCIRILPKLGYIDKPGGRHIHKKPIPRGGGIAVALSFFGTLLFYCFTQSNLSESLYFFFRIFTPALPLLILGLIDDRHELKSWIKLAVQLFVGAIVWYFNKNSFVLFEFVVPWYIALLLTEIWVIGIINAFNLIDGLDGLASGLAIISAVCMFTWFFFRGGVPLNALAMLILAASCAGFLRYNFHPARIFLGDTGSTFLGLMFAIIALAPLDKIVTVTSLVFPLLAVGVPIFDVMLAIWRRGARRMLDRQAPGIMSGDQDHLHHRLFRKTNGQRKTTLWLYALAAFFGSVGIGTMLLRDYIPGLAYILLLLTVVIVVRRLVLVEIFTSALVIERGLRSPNRGMLVTMAHPFIDFFLISAVYLVCAWFLFPGVGTVGAFMFCVMSVMLVMLMVGNYGVYWLRAGARDYLQLFLSLFVGTNIGFVIMLYSCFTHPLSSCAIALPLIFPCWGLFVSLSTGLVIFERFLLHYVQKNLMRALYDEVALADMIPTVVYGAGLNCRLFLDSIGYRSGNLLNIVVLGVLDDDPALKGLRLYGTRVLGPGRDIEAIYQANPFRRIVLTTKLSDSAMQWLLQFCRERNIAVDRAGMAIDHVLAEGDGAQPEK